MKRKSKYRFTCYKKVKEGLYAGDIFVVEAEYGYEADNTLRKLVSDRDYEFFSDACLILPEEFLDGNSITK